MDNKKPDGNITMIGTIAKNTRDTLAIQIKVFKNKYYLDIRTHYTDQEGHLRPTQKGISLEISHFEEFKKFIEKVGPEITKLPPLSS